MPTELHLTTTVLPGHRIEVATPSLPVGTNVELVVTLPQPSTNGMPKPDLILQFLDALPPNKRTAQEWEQLDREIKAEKRSWVL